jgi:photosystem II stability/assembly factor-like uncharacterized protein
MLSRINPLFIFITILSLTYNYSYAQWEVKNIDAHSGSSFDVKKIKFYNDSFGVAVGYNGTILRSTDTGNTWQSIPLKKKFFLEDVSIVDNKIIYATGWNSTQAPLRWWGILIKSQDGGLTWDSISYLKDKQIFCLCFVNKDTGMVAGYNGIYRTINGGITWDTVFAEHPPDIDLLEISAIQFISANTGFALVPHDNGTFLLKTNDAGLTWDTLTLSIPLTYRSAMFFVNTDIGFIGTTETGTLYKTNDGGLTWELNTTFKIPYPDHIKSIYFPSPGIGYAVGGFFGPYFDEGNPKRFFIANTTDSGTTWHTFNKNGIALSALYFLNDSIGFVGGYEGLILKTITGGGDSISGNYPNSIRDQLYPKSENIRVYPTPFTYLLNIELRQPLKDKANIRLINTLGEVIQTSVLTQNETHKTLNIPDTPNGFYFLIISSQSTHKVFKLIRQ